jgi:hypothetical protein
MTRRSPARIPSPDNDSNPCPAPSGTHTHANTPCTHAQPPPLFAPSYRLFAPDGDRIAISEDEIAWETDRRLKFRNAKDGSTGRNFAPFAYWRNASCEDFPAEGSVWETESES